MRLPLFVLSAMVLACMCVAVACSSGSSKPKPTPTATIPGPEDAIADWVRTNRNVAFVGDCDNAKQGVDTGKLCTRIRGERGTRRAYDLGPTFSDATALAIVEQAADMTWKVLSVTNRDPSKGSVPGIEWPLQVGDEVVIIGVGEGDCLRIREQPSQQGKQQICMPDGTKGIVQEGPVDAETFTWWRIAGESFNGWAAAKWLRLPEAIAQALQPPTEVPPPTQ